MISIAISSLRTAATAPTISSSIIAHQRRHLSMTCTQSVHKLNRILEEYRTKNYTQTFPRRFQKDIVKAATINSSSSRHLNIQASASSVSAEGIENVLHNIGAGDRMSRSEIEGILSEVGACPIDGDEDCVISSNQMLNLISKN